MSNYTVYMHIAPSQKKYIGITSRNPIKRWGTNGNGYKGQAFENAINKYGWNNIRHIILFSNLSKEEAENKEIELIAKYKTTDSRFGYNVENGGKSVGRFTEATKKKISESKKGTIPWNKGIPRTKEEKAKMSLSHIGKTVGEKNGNFGKPMSDETKKKISEAKKGQSSYWKGKHIPNHVREALKEKAALKIKRVEDGKIFPSIKIASQEMGVSATAICNCLKGKTSRSGGFHWEYVE